MAEESAENESFEIQRCLAVCLFASTFAWSSPLPRKITSAGGVIEEGERKNGIKCRSKNTRHTFTGSSPIRSTPLYSLLIFHAFYQTLAHQGAAKAAAYQRHRRPRISSLLRGCKPLAGTRQAADFRGCERVCVAVTTACTRRARGGGCVLCGGHDCGDVKLAILRAPSQNKIVAASIPSLVRSRRSFRSLPFSFPSRRSLSFHLATDCTAAEIAKLAVTSYCCGIGTTPAPSSKPVLLAGEYYFDRLCLLSLYFPLLLLSFSSVLVI